MVVSTRIKIKNTKDLEKYREKILTQKQAIKSRVFVCIGTGCMARGSKKILELFYQAVKQTDKQIEIVTKGVGCHGLCEKGPIVVVQPGDIFYHSVEEPDVDEIFRQTVLSGKIVERLLYQDPKTKQPIKNAADIPFYKSQQRIVLAQNGKIDPASVEDYITAGGYTNLAKVLTTMTPEQIIDEVEKSGLRGRGGGGFLTGRKWRSCKNAKGSPKYVICNGDEGDPGAFMDCYIMEGNPHSVLEGMMIGAYAIGAAQGYIYVRNEYPRAVEHLKNAIRQAENLGLLGENILDTGFSFNIKINRGGGAFVCGESTALMASLEGKPGVPRAKYVHTVESGFKDKPTNLNNVETWANIPAIISRGSDWFSSIGTQGSKGTKAFSLAGKGKNTGLIEVPMGITLRQIIYDIGGGIKDDKKFKAVQTGGPSGGCIPAQYLDVGVDFDELTKLGSMMGSGGMIVMDEDTCMVNVAKYFLNFLKEESCGKCTPCREGISQMLFILDRITHGEGKQGDIQRLEDLAELISGTSLCALGQTAANPVLSTIRYFKDEYEIHIKQARCPAKECRGLFSYRIDKDACKACGICKKSCPVQAISGERKVPHTIDQKKCTKCGVCLDKCPFDAVLKV
jgi:NADH-quinone oxidoreductase subunit F